MNDQKFMLCETCKNLVGVIHSSGVPMMCCGKPMVELNANVTDGATEKHVPAVSVDGDAVTVTVGSVFHPMLPEHFIEWIYLKTDKGGHRIKLSAGEEPKAVFTVAGEKPEAVYAYCNLHGLWKTEL